MSGKLLSLGGDVSPNIEGKVLVCFGKLSSSVQKVGEPEEIVLLAYRPMEVASSYAEASRIQLRADPQ